MASCSAFLASEYADNEFSFRLNASTNSDSLDAPLDNEANLFAKYSWSIHSQSIDRSILSEAPKGNQMNNLNWIELCKRTYYVLWGLLIFAFLAVDFNYIVLENRNEHILTALIWLPFPFVAPWALMAIGKWLYAGAKKKGD